MRRNPATIVVLAGQAGPDVLTAIGRSMNVAVVRAEAEGGHADGIGAAADALRRAAGIASAYVVVPADPLAAVAAAWQDMWDVSRQAGPAEFELAAGETITAWRAGRFELPDYYVVIEPEARQQPAPDFYLGPLHSARPHRVTAIRAAEPGEEAAAVLHTLSTLRHGRWWPPLDELITSAREYYPGAPSAG